MKVKCEYCSNIINDTEEKCPYCGAPHSGVRRSADAQPHTIAQLQQWYQDRGLPPAETTRFFIGQDYRKPRAFGIYQDPNTGHFIVYKNKDSGQRAIRYEGTDEAYAVNELYQRLKQEITEQKLHNAQKQSSGNSGRKSSRKPLIDPDSWLGILLGAVKGMILYSAALLFGGIMILVVLGIGLTIFEPKEGYYDYHGAQYYHSSASYGDDSWFLYNRAQQEWTDVIPNDRIPQEFTERSTAKKYLVSSKWDPSLGVADFADSIFAKDLAAGIHSGNSYYCCDDTYYYHLGYQYNTGWYRFDQRWTPVRYQDLPLSLQHSSTAADLCAGNTYSLTFPVSDFEDTLYYRDYNSSGTAQKGYYRTDNQIYYHLADDYYDGWYGYDYDTWYPVDTQDLPEELSHPSNVEDFYYTPTWDSYTQFTDFEDTDLYYANKDNWNDSDSDSDYDWDSSDSWDSDSSDWDSNW